MQRSQRLGEGIELRYDDAQWMPPVEAAVRVRSLAEAARIVGAAPVAPPGAAGGAEWIIRRLLAAGLADKAATVPLVRTASRAMPGASSAPVLRVPLADDENAVLLVESEGVVAWQFPDRVADASPATRALRADATREAQFTVVEPGRAAAVHPRQLAGLREGLVAQLEATVLRFLARRAAGGIVAALEADKRTGPVVVTDAKDPARWEEAAAFPFVRAPSDGPARILLFVHGTFSSVAGAFGGLCATPAGQALLEAARAKYAGVWGWDHRTLCVDPKRNARELYDALQAITLARPPVIDIVCHSRGGLVARALVEEVLPSKVWRPAIGRIVFTAAANAGTELARPANWRTLIDLFTNLVLAGQVALARAGAPQVALVAGEAIDAIAGFVRYAVEAGLDRTVAPGLAAMDPGGDFVREMNDSSAGAAARASCDCYAIESDFEPRIVDEATHAPPEFPRRLALMLAHGFVDALMEQAPNDLVVDVRSMGSLRAPGEAMKGVQDYGRNAVVYHTNYFLQPATIESIATWLELAKTGGGDATRLRASHETSAAVRVRA